MNKRFGALLVIPLAVMCSLFLSTLFADAASAVNGTWKDRGTITVNGVDYKGPTDGAVFGDPVVKLFKPTSGSTVVYFTLVQASAGYKDGYFKPNTLLPDKQPLVMNSTQPDPPPTGGGGGDGDEGDGDEETTPDTCAVDGVGWIVCPVVTFMSKVTDGAYEYAEKLLYFEVANAFSTNPKLNPIYALWSSVRNVANIVFVLAFFAVIFSQATSVGISAYGIRKMLPRIIVAAILVNLSYYICIFAIDVSNIIGSGLNGLIATLPSATAPSIKEGNTWEDLASNILVGSAAIGVAIGMVMLASGTVLAFLVFSLLAIVTALAIFMTRHVLLIMLIILSPLAFVAYILPNTENLFDKWRKAFIAMLVMYPLVALLFAGTKVASGIMRSTADQVGGELTWLYKLFSLAVLAIPLFGIPWIVKFSGGFIGRVAGMVNDRNKGLVDRARKIGDKGAAVRRAEAGSRIRGGVRNVGNKAGLDKAGAWGYNADGTKKKGLRAFAKRRAGGALSAPTRAGFGQFERDARQSQVKEELQKARERQLSGSISREEFKDADGKVDEEKFQAAQTRRQQTASVAAMRSAGVAGVEGASNIKRLAEEQSRKRYNDEVDRVLGGWTSAELWNHETKVTLKDRETGKAVLNADGSVKELGMHERLGAIGSGQVIEWTDATGKTHVVDGKSSEYNRAAAFKRVAETADKKAVNVLDLDAEIGDPGQFTVTDEADKALLRSYLGGSQGLAGPTPHYRQSKAGAFNSPTAGKVQNYSAEETMLAVKFHREERDKLQSSLEIARQSGDVDAQRTIQRALDARQDIIKNFVSSYQEAFNNDNARPNLDGGAVSVALEFARREGMDLSYPGEPPVVKSIVEKAEKAGVFGETRQQRPSPTPTPAQTSTPTPSATPSPTPTPAQTSTPTPSATPSSTRRDTDGTLNVDHPEDAGRTQGPSGSFADRLDRARWSTKENQGGTPPDEPRNP